MKTDTIHCQVQSLGQAGLTLTVFLLKKQCLTLNTGFISAPTQIVKFTLHIISPSPHIVIFRDKNDSLVRKEAIVSCRSTEPC